jgi:hypothetical protein
MLHIYILTTAPMTVSGGDVRLLGRSASADSTILC